MPATRDIVSKSSRLRSWAPLLLVCAAIATSYSQWAINGFGAFLVEDSGLFLHTGQRMLAGDRLYVDIWDNKPPIVYYANALGLWLTRGSPAGPLLICLVMVWITVAVLWKSLREQSAWSLTAVPLMLFHLATLRLYLHPNFTETFAMPLQAIGVALLLFELRTGAPGRTAFWQGIVAALLACTRPNNIGIAVIYGLWVVISCRRTPTTVIGAAFRSLAGIAVALIVVFIPLFIQNTWREGVQAAIFSAGAYAAENGNISRIVTGILGFYRLSSTALLTAAAAAVFAAIALRRKLDPNTRSSLLLLVAWWAIEIVLSSLSGYRWHHYYLTWLVPMTALLIIVANTFAPSLHTNLRTAVASAFGALLVLVVIGAGFETLRLSANPAPTSKRAVALVRKHLRDGDTFVSWATGSHDIWFRLNLKPGVSIFHEAAYTNRDIYRTLAVRFLDDFERNLPRVVLETHSIIPLLAEPDPNERFNQAFEPSYFLGWDTPDLTARKQALARKYHPVDRDRNFILFIRND